MVLGMGGLLRKLLRIPHEMSAVWWVYERVVNNWVMLASLFGGGAMTYFATISEWLEPWGPIGWASVGLATFVLLVFALTLVNMARAWTNGRRVMAEFTARHLTTTATNPLQDTFEKERIKAWDFYHPFFEHNNQKTFRACEIVGPCNVLLNGVTNMPKSKFRECEFVIVDPSKGMKGVVSFNDCSFFDCTFYRITFFASAEYARDVKRQILESGTYSGPEPLNVISDGHFGKI